MQHLDIATMMTMTMTMRFRRRITNQDVFDLFATNSYTKDPYQLGRRANVTFSMI